MSTRVQISVLIYAMVQAVLFGIVTVLVLATPLALHAVYVWPALIGASFLLALPLSWYVAPRLMMRKRVRGHKGTPPTSERHVVFRKY